MNATGSPILTTFLNTPLPKTYPIMMSRETLMVTLPGQPWTSLCLDQVLIYSQLINRYTQLETYLI